MDEGKKSTFYGLQNLELEGAEEESSLKNNESFRLEINQT